jgi:hypothetical protein
MIACTLATEVPQACPCNGCTCCAGAALQAQARSCCTSPAHLLSRTHLCAETRTRCARAAAVPPQVLRASCCTCPGRRACCTCPGRQACCTCPGRPACCACPMQVLSAPDDASAAPAPHGPSARPSRQLGSCHSHRACPMHAGAAKILWQMPIIWFILGKYAAASALTIISDNAITAVAWDSAGVTTGEGLLAASSHHVLCHMQPCHMQPSCAVSHAAMCFGATLAAA